MTATGCAKVLCSLSFISSYTNLWWVTQPYMSGKFYFWHDLQKYFNSSFESNGGKLFRKILREYTWKHSTKKSIVGFCTFEIGVAVQNILQFVTYLLLFREPNRQLPSQFPNKLCIQVNSYGCTWGIGVFAIL